ncbi:MAG: DUF72 domain-containing protein [Bryobacteraceae bacterium]
MATPPLFQETPSFDRRRLAERLQRLAEQGIFIGTSSWKYEGWIGQIYTRERYLVRGAFSQRRFEAECLAEYAETFPVVGGDFSFYQFPSEGYWRRLFASAPASLRFALKVPEQITVKIWPTHARYGVQGGQVNPSFLNRDLLERAFLARLEPYRDRVAALIFEFGTFSKQAYATVDEFLQDLDRFLGCLPAGFRYSVELRNPEYLVGDYFDCLRARRVAHVFNAWTRMPELDVQLRIPGAFTTDFTVCRALLRRGRTYEEAVRLFAPYDRIKDPNPRGRQALRRLIESAQRDGRSAFIFVNNRFEGNAPATIEAIVEG